MAFRFALVPVVLAACWGSALGEEPAAAEAGKVSYYRDIRPIFQEHCQGCHQPAKASGGLVMSSLAEVLKGGESELPGYVAGKPEESEIYLQVTSQGGAVPLMPKERPPLSAAAVELIRRWIAEGAEDDTPTTAREVVDSAHPPVYAAAPVVTALTWSPDGTLLAVSGYHEVLLYSADGSQLLARLVGLSERIETTAFSPDGKLLAVTGGSPGRFGEVQVWDVAERSLKLSLSVTFDTIRGVSWSGDGTKLAFGCADNSLRAIETVTGKQVLYQGAHSDWVLDTTFSTDASHVISVSRDRSMKLTEVATERFVDNITSITPGALKGGLMTVARHPARDELLIGGADGVPKLYKTYREQVRQIGDDFNKIREYAAMPGRINAAEFNADGSRMVIGSSSDGTGMVRVYQTDDAALVSEAEGTPGPVYAVAFHPAGNLVAAAGFDGVVRIYDPATGKLIKEFVSVPISAEVAAVR
jgi:WD40 repeat protein